MAILDILKPKKTPEETQQSLQAIKDYNTALSALNVQVKTLVGNNAILPDTANYSYKIIVDAQNWIKKNPNAEVSEIMVNLQDLQTKFQSIQETEPSRRVILVWLAKVASVSTELLTAKLITDAQQKELLTLVKTVNDWYKKNEFTASPPEFQQKADDGNSQLTQIYNNDANLSTYTNTRFVQFSALPPPELLKTLTTGLNKLNVPSPTQKPGEAKKQINLQNTAAEAAKPASAPGIIMSTAQQAFSILFLIFIILLGGSFSANLAIGRTNPYRVLYFLYGCIPFFSPFIILYVIYLRIRYGPVPLYGIFPLSTEPATTRLGKILWYPFYWIPDGKSTELEQEFLKSLIV